MHARGGDRSRYQPLASPLVRSSDPLDVVHGLRSLAGFGILYIADLDAIRGGQGHCQQLADLRARFPEIDLWIDAGITDRRSLENFLELDLGTPVLGSETLCDETLLAWERGAEPILSLDYRGDHYLGSLDPASTAHKWPRRIIAMSLDRVGSARGPNTERVSRLLSDKPGAEIYAAGGVRTVEDLLGLASAGASGALIGTAIYSGHLPAETLFQYTTPPRSAE